MTFDFLLANEIALLLVPLAVFLLIATVSSASGKSLPMARVGLTIKAAVLGILLTVLARFAPVPHAVAPYFREILGLIVLFCWANLLAYLAADLYLPRRMKGEVPTFLRELVLLAVYLFFAATALRWIFDIGMASILTTTTVITAALAFSMQTSLASIVSGFYIQSDRNFRHRTWLMIKDKDVTGEIVNVGFRYTTVRTTAGHRVHIPNSFLTQNVVHTIGNREEGPAGINLKVLLDYTFRPERARELLLAALRDEPGILADPAPTVRVDAFQDNGIQYNLRFYLEEYGTILKARDGILERVWYAVTREGQSFPYPHREVIRKEAAPAFRIGEEAIRGYLRGIDFLAPLGEEGLDLLARNVRLRVYGKGEKVVRQGEEGSSLFIVLEGGLEVLLDGRKVGELSGGEFFGEMSLLTGENRSATVVAAEEVRLIEVSKEELAPVIFSHPSILTGLSESLERRLEQIAAARRARTDEVEPSPPQEAILRKLMRFFGIS
jgi:small-conductance mechanosensitive channel